MVVHHAGTVSALLVWQSSLCSPGVAAQQLAKLLLLAKLAPHKFYTDPGY